MNLVEEGNDIQTIKNFISNERCLNWIWFSEDKEYEKARIEGGRI